MNKYTVTIHLEVEVWGDDELFAHDHALECVDEYDGDTRITCVEVRDIELTSRQCDECGEWEETEEVVHEFVCDDCKEDN